MQRACAAALLHKGRTVLKNPGNSDDDKAAIQVITDLGVICTMENGEWRMENDGLKLKRSLLDCGESGLSIRMFTPIAALLADEITITGKGSLLNRPMNFFDEVLPMLNVAVQSNNGKLPLKIKGSLQPKNIAIDGSLSSQFLTGLLMAYAAADAKDVTIKVKDLKSKPYIDLTLDVMKHFGMKLPQNNHYTEFYFNNTTANANPSTVHYTVESDWSGAAFLLVAGAIAGDITVKGLDVFSTQADKKVLEALMDCGARISVQPGQIDISAAKLSAFHFNATDCPDLFPPLVALAAYCEGSSVIEGVNRLRHKESDRANTLKEEFARMGLKIQLQDDLMIIEGSSLAGADTFSHHDHRIVMALAVAALKANGETNISAAESINKSYPSFFEDLKKLGASVSLTN
jgi:3-phosphoshikimate 1-carboxyvinyltransferase